MKTLLFLAATLFITNAHAMVECKTNDTEFIKWAESQQKKAKERFEKGLVSVIDLREADAFLAEVKYCSGQIDKATFCIEGLSLAKTKLQSVEAGYEVGVRTATDLFGARSSIAEIEKHCAE